MLTPEAAGTNHSDRGSYVRTIIKLLGPIGSNAVWKLDPLCPIKAQLPAANGQPEGLWNALGWTRVSHLADQTSRHWLEMGKEGRGHSNKSLLGRWSRIWLQCCG